MGISDEFREFELKLRSGRGVPRFRIGPILLAVGALFVLIAAFSSYYTVAPEGRAVVKRFGKVVDVTPPGLHFKLPFGIETATFVETERVQKLEFGFRTERAGVRTRYAATDLDEESMMLTGDLNVVDVSWVVQYLIRDPDRWLHAVRQPEDTIRAVTEAVMRRVVGNRLGSDVLTIGRVEIANQVRDELQRMLDLYGAGVQVSSVELQDVTPPDPVKPAFNEVNEARQEKERLVNLAEKERNQLIPRARGEAAQTISEAEAYAAERINAAKGEAARFTAILEEYLKGKEVTRQRLYLEMLDAVLPKVRDVYVIDETGVGPLPLLDLGRKGGER
jgi:membrane protease subunit HflK